MPRKRPYIRINMKVKKTGGRVLTNPIGEKLKDLIMASEKENQWRGKNLPKRYLTALYSRKSESSIGESKKGGSHLRKFRAIGMKVTSLGCSLPHNNGIFGKNGVRLTDLSNFTGSTRDYGAIGASGGKEGI